MEERYKKLIEEIEKISIQIYKISEILHGYCLYCDGEKIYSSLVCDFINEIKEKQQKIIKLIDEKTTQIGYELSLKKKETKVQSQINNIKNTKQK